MTTKTIKRSKKHFSNHGARKTKKQSLQLGGGVFSIEPKTYRNVKYRKSGYEIPILTCLQCKNTVFRHHKIVTDSRLRAAALGEDAQLFGKKNNNFVCYKCGFIMTYSGDITYSSTKA